jgi:hypothetical protein
MNEELLEIIKNFNGFHPDMLYDELVVLKRKSEFDNNEFRKFIILYTLIMGKNILDAKQVKTYLEKIKDVPQYKIERINNTLDDISSNWIGIDLSNNGHKANLIKIYLSIDNSSLHHFTNLFLISCLEHGYTDFDFKINKRNSANRRDNVVIYCNDKNIGKYIKLIKKIIKDNPGIVFNNPHLLCISVDKHIYCGLDFDNGNISYTDKICKTIFDALNKGQTPEEIVTILDAFKIKHEPALIALINMPTNNDKR